jgi:glycogen debranching enzyme
MSTERSEPIVIDGISYIPSSVLLTGISKVSFKDNRAFCVVDSQGECLRLYAEGGELGIYYNDTRYLGVWEQTINGLAPIALAHELRFNGNTVVYSMTNPDLPKLGPNAGVSGRIRRDSFLIRRIQTLVDDVFYDMTEIKNFEDMEHWIQLEQWAGSRFDDVFEVRGYVRPKRGRLLPPIEETQDGRSLSVLRYEGLDGQIRETFIQRHFEVEKIRVSPGLLGYFARVRIPAKGSAILRTQISFDRPPSQIHFPGGSYASLNVEGKMMALAHKSGENNPLQAIELRTNNEILNRAIKNAEIDIFTLLTRERDHLLYPYAGIPWFSAPFGRDGLITGYQLLPWAPAIAHGILEYVFETIGTKTDAFTEEQPGKIFHEVRRGEMAQTREVPFTPYFGSIDSTPLALILLEEYVRWTSDHESLRRWWPSAISALEWVRSHWQFESAACRDRDGFLGYLKQSETGLINQGWKDSHDSVMYADGQLAVGPIRLCEAQAYAFRSLMAMSSLALLMKDESLSAQLRVEALELRSRFIERFWEGEQGFVHLALDGQGQPCAVKSSNMGHCLWARLLSFDQARSVARHLMSHELFSGYGIRTLASNEVAYNPMSYHNGSVWPHDNSLIMEGLRYYGLNSELEKLCQGMMSVLESSRDFRLPELFCGFRKRAEAPPVPYAVACKPQAWAAGSVFLMLKSMLGLSIDPEQKHVVLHQPVLPIGIDTLEVRGLSGAEWELDFAIRRARGNPMVEVLRKSGSIRVVVIK